IITTVLIAALAAIIISLAVIRSLQKQLKNIQTGITQFSQGNLEHRIAVPDSRYFGTLTETLNTMAAGINQRIDAITSQRNELEAVFSGMSEGVIVTDDRQRIIAINKAGTSLLNVDAEATVGRGIAEIIYNPELQQLIDDVFAQGKTVEKDIILYKDKKRNVQVSGTAVDTASGQRVVIVLTDMTRIHQLENMRREFVSNVSHELKTPITAIKGFVETLLDGSIHSPEESKKFLEIIAKHTSRLNAIIEDLLNLSRIEQEIESEHIIKEIGSIKSVMAAAATACQSKATEKQIAISISGDDTLTAPINAPLLEQALVNLIDNAIKYSDLQKHIHLQAKRDNGNITIRVTDEGY
ncbi:MAG: histidine kinase dimerization/phospho-acceptor domain-containing protein, partial [Sedimentisphaerales bacterium]|nr:histidine kinase dimerization/phospho-acceptor domain-containing protein [Sedimentisphaerales bacterium]